MDDINEAIKILDIDTDAALKYIEYWLLDKDEELADIVNTEIRDTVYDLVRKVNKLRYE